MPDARPLLNIEIDGKPLQVAHGTSVIEAADSSRVSWPGRKPSSTK